VNPIKFHNRFKNEKVFLIDSCKINETMNYDVMLFVLLIGMTWMSGLVANTLSAE
jgi:hypothetical protein